MNDADQTYPQAPFENLRIEWDFDVLDSMCISMTAGFCFILSGITSYFYFPLLERKGRVPSMQTHADWFLYKRFGWWGSGFIEVLIGAFLLAVAIRLAFRVRTSRSDTSLYDWLRFRVEELTAGGRGLRLFFVTLFCLTYLLAGAIIALFITDVCGLKTTVARLVILGCIYGAGRIAARLLRDRNFRGLQRQLHESSYHLCAFCGYSLQNSLTIGRCSECGSEYALQSLSRDWRSAMNYSFDWPAA